MSDPLTTARLEVIAAKAKILAEQYKNGSLWEGELSRGIDEIQSELTALRRGNRSTDRSDYINDR